MEGHSNLAEWLALQESEITLYVFTRIHGEESIYVPSWLKDGIKGAKHIANITNLRGLYESGAGVRRISAHIALSCNT